MKIAYLIPAHQDPAHLARLITRLSSPTSSFMIHVDAKSDIDRFTHLRGPDVAFTHERVEVWWGDYSQVEATLTLIRAALADPRHVDRLVLISGADYPLRSTAYIERFFEQRPDSEFMNLVEMPNDAAGKPLSRLTTYQPGPGRSPVGRRFHRVVLAVGRRVHRRNYEAALHRMTPYGGSTWWALSRGACELIISFVDGNEDYGAFFRHAICPDETFFQTIIGNSLLGPNVRRNVTYVDWSAGGQNPSAFTEAHVERFRKVDALHVSDVYGSGELLFARKFTDGDTTIVDAIDRMIVEQARSNS